MSNKSDWFTNYLPVCLHVLPKSINKMTRLSRLTPDPEKHLKVKYMYTNFGSTKKYSNKTAE